MAGTARNFCLQMLSASEVVALGERLRRACQGANHRQAVADLLVAELYTALQTESGDPACALVRCFQTCQYARLPLEYQHAADALFEETKAYPNVRCLTLLATRGMRSVWNDVATSIGHQAIPLPSVEVVRRAPMIARLLEQMDVSLERVVAQREPLPDVAQANGLQDGASDGGQDGGRPLMNVFHVQQARGSAFLPAQEEFVVPFGVESVLGMGGLMPEGELLVVLLFSKVPLSGEVAERLRALATDIRELFLPFASNRTFEPIVLSR